MPIRFSSFCGSSSHESEPSAPRRALLGAKGVDKKRDIRSLHVLEEQGRPSRLGDTVGDFRNLKLRVYLRRNALQLPFGFEERDELAQVLERGWHL